MLIFLIIRDHQSTRHRLNDNGNENFYYRVLFERHFDTNESDKKMILLERRFNVIFTAFSRILFQKTFKMIFKSSLQIFHIFLDS